MPVKKDLGVRSVQDHSLLLDGETNVANEQKTSVDGCEVALCRSIRFRLRDRDQPTFFVDNGFVNVFSTVKRYSGRIMWSGRRASAPRLRKDSTGAPSIEYEFHRENFFPQSEVSLNMTTLTL